MITGPVRGLATFVCSKKLIHTLIRFGKVVTFPIKSSLFSKAIIDMVKFIWIPVRQRNFSLTTLYVSFKNHVQLNMRDVMWVSNFHLKTSWFITIERTDHGFGN